MTRKKVKLMWIVNDVARKTSLKKRRVGLLKKVSELTTLCGIEAFIIIYSPDDLEPIVWPSVPEVEQIILRFRNMSEIDRQKKMMNQESYLKERIGKMHEESKKHIRKTKEIEISYLMHKVHEDKGFDRLDQTQLCDLSWMVEEKLKEIRRKKEYFQQISSFQPPDSFPSSSAAPHGPNDGDQDDEARGEVQRELDVENPTDVGKSWDEWFSDIVNNPEHNISAGGSSTIGDLGMSHQFSLLGGSSYEEPDVGFYHDVGEEPNILRSDLLLSRSMGSNTPDGMDSNMGVLPHDHQDSTIGQFGPMGELPHNINFQEGNNTIFEPQQPFGFNLEAETSDAGNIFQPQQPFGFNLEGRNIFEPHQPFGFNLEGGIRNNLDQSLPQRAIIGDNSGANNPDQWLPLVGSATVNQYDPWLARADTAGDRDLGYELFPSSNVLRSNTGGDHFQGLDQHRGGNDGGGASNAGQNDAGLPGYLGGSSDFEFPFDSTKDCPHHNP